MEKSRRGRVPAPRGRPIPRARRVARSSCRSCRSLPFCCAKYVGSRACVPLASPVLCASRPGKNGPLGETPSDRPRPPAQGCMGHDRPALPFHAGQFRRQDGPATHAVPIMEELKLSYEQFGLLGSSFFFLFAVSAVAVGFIANRVPSKWTLLAMAVVWSVVQFPMVGIVNLEILMACRIVLGAGEGPAAPIATHAIYKWFP